MLPDGKDAGYLWDILEAARLVGKFIGDMDEEGFKTDLKTQSAVVRQLEIIGEAASRLSEKFRANHPHVEWRKMVGLRNILIHAYDHIVLEVVWEIAMTSAPRLVNDLEPLLPPEPPDG